MTTNVLFLCTGNSARSQMAEAFLRRLGGDEYQAFSAGMEPKGMHPLTLRVMSEIGYDLSGQRSKGVDEFLGKQHLHYVITVCDHAAESCPRVWPGVHRRLHWSFQDPAAAAGSEADRLAKFRQVRDQIQEQVLRWLRETPSLQS